MKCSKFGEHSLNANEENKTSLIIATTTTSKLQQQMSTSASFKTKPARRADSPSPAPSTTSSSSDECSSYNTPESSILSSPRSSHSLASTTSTAGNYGLDCNTATSPSVDSWTDDDDGDDEDNDNVNDEENVDNVQFFAARDEDDHYADDDDSDMNENDRHKIEQDVDNMLADVEDDEHNGDILYALETAEEQISNLEMALADCTTGYLISNTTLGNLLQPQEVPLTDNFIVSDTDLCTNEDTNDNLDIEFPSTSARAVNTRHALQQQKHGQEQDQEQENNDNNNSDPTTHSISLQDPKEISVCQQSSINNTFSIATTSSNTRRSRYSEQHPRSQSQILSQTQSPLQSYSQLQPNYCSNKDQNRSHRHHHRHHHHHHHHLRHSSHYTHSLSSSSRTMTTTGTTQHSQSHHRHRGHHGHHHRPPHRHGGGEKHDTKLQQCEEYSVNKESKEDHTIANSKDTPSIAVLDIETPSSSSSILEDNKTAMLRSSGKIKFK